MRLINKGFKLRSSEYAPIHHVGTSPVQIVYVKEEIDHGFNSLKIPERLNDIEIRETENIKLDVLLNHHAYVTMFKCTETCEQGYCHLETKCILLERHSATYGENDLRECLDNNRQ